MGWPCRRHGRRRRLDRRVRLRARSSERRAAMAARRPCRAQPRPRPFGAPGVWPPRRGTGSSSSTPTGSSTWRTSGGSGRRAGRADLVLGVRVDRQDPSHRLLLTRAVRVVVSLLAGRRLATRTCLSGSCAGRFGMTWAHASATARWRRRSSCRWGRRARLAHRRGTRAPPAPLRHGAVDPAPCPSDRFQPARARRAARASALVWASGGGDNEPMTTSASRASPRPRTGGERLRRLRLLERVRAVRFERWTLAFAGVTLRARAPAGGARRQAAAPRREPARLVRLAPRLRARGTSTTRSTTGRSSST